MARPDVTCVMVTQPGRDAHAVRSLDCFLRQQGVDAELLIVSDSPCAELPMLWGAAMDADGSGSRIRFVHAPDVPTLGGLRNVGIDRARGDFVAQWDDDDQFHPSRLRIQLEALQSRNGVAAFLQDQLYYLVAANQLYWISWRGVVTFTAGKNMIPGTILHRRDVAARYPEMRRQEDSWFRSALLEAGTCVPVAGQGWCYLRQFHGANTWEEPHHLRLLTERARGIECWSKVPLAQLGLAEYHWPHESVTLCGKHGRKISVDTRTWELPLAVACEQQGASVVSAHPAGGLGE